MSLSIAEKKELFEEFKKELQEAQNIKIETCRSGVELPQYGKPEDVGMNIRAAYSTAIHPGQTKIIPTGLKMETPSGYELQIRPGDDISITSPLRISSTPQIMETSYPGEIGIVVHNASTNETTSHYYPVYSTKEQGNKPGIYRIEKGERIAQIVLVKIEKINLVPTKQRVYSRNN